MAEAPAPTQSVIDVDRLARWLGERIPGAGEPLRAEPLLGGSSNILFKLERGGRRFVLRRPPEARYDKTSHNIAREARLLAALADTDAPHPPLYAYCDDAEVIGAPFIVTAFVDGFPPIGPLPAPFDTDPDLRRGLGFGMVEALAQLVKVDWREAGLDGFGKPDGFLDRQVDRWLSQLERYKTRDIPRLDELARALRETRPEQAASALIHGDYSFPNVLFAFDAPARIAAIVDWESATIGDPLLDFGHLLAGWCDPGETRTYLRDIDWTGLPTRAELIERYEALTGLPTAAIEHYRALALFKLAIVLEGAYARFLNGQSSYAPHRTLEERVPAFIAHAADIIEGAARDGRPA